ncbi:hypothetical protein [Bacillus coahuilensis]|uniref:hypothetical protein n=1 Tax=Bacillus coahuilensis TaxID=408580 RepID=UPI00128F77A1|nr:hypothetical protein [Bacillus coahuilensis]
MKRRKYLAEAETLEQYVRQLQRSMDDFQDSAVLFQTAHRDYTPGWTGQARDAYESTISELEKSESIVHTVYEELVAEVHEEMDRLRSKAEGLR